MALVKTSEIEIGNASMSGHHSLTENDDFVICKSPEKLKQVLKAIKAGVTVNYISDGDWSMHDLVIELLKLYQPADLFITTYAIREFPIRQLILAQDAGKLRSINMVLDYRAKARTPEVFHLAAQNVNRIVLTAIHAKVTVLRTAINCITITGSANWTQNPRIEQGTISLNKSLAEFHIDWINKILENGEAFD